MSRGVTVSLSHNLGRLDAAHLPHDVPEVRARRWHTQTNVQVEAFKKNCRGFKGEALKYRQFCLLRILGEAFQKK